MKNGKYRLHPFTVYTYETVDSTNAVARRSVEMLGASADMCVHAAGSQTDGRGRRGRTWLDTDGAVMMSIVQKTRLPMEKLPILNLVSAAAVRNAMMRLVPGAELSVKWPNDVVTSDRYEKVCGILSEAVSSDGDRYAVIGIGLNLNAAQMPQGLLQPATSIFLATGKRVPLTDAINGILLEYDRQYRLFAEDPEAFLSRFAESCISLGRHVKVISADGTRYGVGEKLSPNGQLMVRYEDGVTGLVYAADVSVRSGSTVDEKLAKRLLPKRSPRSNKGDNGRAALIVGSPDMPGAALMSVKACVKAGAGLTRALIPPAIAPAFGAVPEAMLVQDDARVEELIAWADAVCIGCGMGVSDRTAALLEKVLKSKKPCVIDADALNTLSKHPELYALLHENALITPHPGEMGRLTGRSAAEVANDLSATAAAFASEHNCCVLLKSASSVIASPDGLLRYNDSGTPALAKGGSGDVLAGLVTSMAAQGASVPDAAALGAYLLGTSAEKAMEFLSDRFASATDIIDIVAFGLGINK